jgi:hypothetical protein
MTVRKSTTYSFVLVVVIAVFAALASAGLIVSAQNSNSSMTMAPQNDNTSKPRRHKSKPKPKPAAEATDTGAMAETSPTAMPRKGRCDPNQQEQTDLSGTYNGKVKHGDDPAMDGTLTITGNNFTMTAGSNTHSGRIVAVTTCGYTAVTVMPEGANQAHSLRAKRMGSGLTLTSVPGEPEKMMFTTGGGMRRPRKHTTKKPAAPAATTTNPPQQ